MSDLGEKIHLIVLARVIHLNRFIKNATATVYHGLFRYFLATNANGFFEILSYLQKIPEIQEKFKSCDNFFGILCKMGSWGF